MPYDSHGNRKFLVIFGDFTAQASRPLGIKIAASRKSIFDQAIPFIHDRHESSQHPTLPSSGWRYLVEWVSLDFPQFIKEAIASWLYYHVVTGCSSGIGREIAEFVASKSQRLIATARNPSTLSYLLDNNPNILKLSLDVTSSTSVSEAFNIVVAHFRDSYHINVIINNAGYSLLGDTKAATKEEAHQEIETLFFSIARVTI
jgi:hypothetical protein